MRYLAAAIVASALLSGCATQQAKDSFSSSVLGLQGSDRDTVLYQMGAPDSSVETSNGEILTYRDEYRDKLRGYYDYTFKCQVDFQITDGTVSNVQYSGSSSHPYYSDLDNCAEVFSER